MRIVVADDSEIIKQRIRERLAKIKDITIVGEAASGPGAMRELKGKMPDMLILDIRMPEMSGIEVLKKIRSNDAFSGCRVCMFTIN